MHLAPATPAEAADRDRLSYEAWGDGMPLDRHLLRERRLRSGFWPRTAHTTWLWRGPDGPLASCETYASPCALDGAAGTTWQIASVYTEPRLRGRGHASAMLAAVAEAAAARGAFALALYSDVDPGIYARLGFVAREAWDRRLPAEPGDPEAEAAGFAESELFAACAHAPDAGPGFTFRVSPGQLDWQLDRARVQAELDATPRPARCGARCGDERIVWSDDRLASELLVLELRAKQHGEVLLRAAARTAHALGLARVRGWETAAWPSHLGERAARKGALPMLKPLVSGVDPAAWTEIDRGLWV